MQLMVPMGCVVHYWLTFLCELSFMVVYVFSCCFNRSRVKSYVLVPAFFWKIKSEIAVNVTTCSNEQTSTAVSKLTLQQEPPQEQACRSNCTGDIYFFFHRCVKVAHDNQVCDSHQLWHNRFSGVWSGSPEAPLIWASACNDTCYSKRKWFQLLTWAVPKACQRGLQKIPLQSCTSLRSLSNRLCLFLLKFISAFYRDRNGR